MKKVFFAAASCLLLLSSCGAIGHYTTATTVPVSNVIATASVADLEVGARTSFTYSTSDKERLSGADNCKRAAVAAMLKANGNADVLVAPEFSYDGRMKVIEVTGRPAKYKNFRSAQ